MSATVSSDGATLAGYDDSGPFTLDGEIAERLDGGGAYGRLDGSAGEAKRLGQAFRAVWGLPLTA